MILTSSFLQPRLLVSLASLCMMAIGCSAPGSNENAPPANGADASLDSLDTAPHDDATDASNPDDANRDASSADSTARLDAETTDGRSEDAAEADVVAPDAGTFTCHGSGARFVTSVVDHHFGPGQDFGQDKFPTPILGPPKGGGCCKGSLDVVSLGNGGWVVVQFDGNEIVDGPGPDLLVFENPFELGGPGGQVFAELATVLVSEDGVDWREFPCSATQPPYEMCAGWHPVYANPDENDRSPTDPDQAGGDPFDLADVELKRARYVKIVDRADLDGANGVFDLDAVAIVHAACP